jgi:hypothetical protein
MNRSLVRVLSLVGALAVPAGLLAQAAYAPTPSTTTETKTTTTTKKKKARKHHAKTMHHHKKTTMAPAPTPVPKM